MSDFKAKMHQIRFPQGLCQRPPKGAYSTPLVLLSVFKGLTSMGTERKEGRKGNGRGKGRRRGGEELGRGRGRDGGRGKEKGRDLPDQGQTTSYTPVSDCMERPITYSYAYVPVGTVIFDKNHGAN